MFDYCERHRSLPPHLKRGGLRDVGGILHDRKTQYNDG